MTLTRQQLYAIRAWVGGDPTEKELEERFDDLGGDAREVARQVLQERLGDLTSSPAVWNAAGDYSEDNKDVIATLRQQVADLSLLIDGQTIPGYDPEAADTAAPAQLQRDDRERLGATFPG